MLWWKLALTVTALVVTLFLAILSWHSSRRRESLRLDRSVVTPRALFDYLNAAIATNVAVANKLLPYRYHAVYDFTDRRVVLLRTDGRTTVAHRSFSIPDTDRYHVRFPPATELHRRVAAVADVAAEASAATADAAMALRDLVDIVDVDAEMNDVATRLEKRIDPLKSCGGARLRFSGASGDRVVLRFDDDAILRLRAPSNVDFAAARRDDGSIRLRFRSRVDADSGTPCTTAFERDGRVLLTDYSRYYVGLDDGSGRRRGDTTEVPYMRWLCKSSTDPTPVLTLR